jgi:uncharacterized protein (TIRG00374 family)
LNRWLILLILLIAVAVFVGLTVYGNTSELVESVKFFSPFYWLVALALALCNYLMRLLRWNYYLHELGMRVDRKLGVVVFIAGLSMVVTPSRIGELAKAYFLKDKAGVPVATSAPAVITERITDVGAVLLLGIWGLASLKYGWFVVAGTLVVVAALTAFLASPRAVERLAHLPVFRKWKPFFSTSGDSFRRLLSPKALAIGLVLGCAAWCAEGLAFWFVLHGLASPLPFTNAVSIYCGATLVGAISMLPGGLVGTEGGMVAMLHGAGLTSTVAAASTLIVRICTLWFAVLLGATALLYLHFGIAGTSAPRGEAREPTRTSDQNVEKRERSDSSVT